MIKVTKYFNGKLVLEKEETEESLCHRIVPDDPLTEVLSLDKCLQWVSDEFGYFEQVELSLQLISSGTQGCFEELKIILKDDDQNEHWFNFLS